MKLTNSNIVKLDNGNIKLVAEDGYIIQSKSMHLDKESGQDIADVSGKTIYLGKNDVVENYIKVKTEDL